MTIPRLYVPFDLHSGSSVIIDDKQAHYLHTVLRKKPGDAVLLFNGRQGEWHATITGVTKKQIHAELLNQTRMQQPTTDIWLCFAPIKNGRIDFLVEKATELGASKLLPVQTERTVISRVNHTKCVANAIEASEQTERLDVPEVLSYQPLLHMLDRWDESRTLLYGDETGQGALAEDAFAQLSTSFALLIGPEGGFTQKEFNLLRTRPYARALHLGKRVLRADTAALSALTLAQYFAGDGKERLNRK